MVCVDSLLGTAVRFNVGRNNSHKIGQLPNGSRHRLTFGMLPSEQATCGADRGTGNAQIVSGTTKVILRTNELWTQC